MDQARRIGDRERMSEATNQKAERLLNNLVDKGFDLDSFMDSLEQMGRAWAEAYGVDYDSLDGSEKK